MYRDSKFCLDPHNANYNYALSNKGRKFVNWTALAAWTSGRSLYPLFGTGKVYFEYKHLYAAPGVFASQGIMVGFCKSSLTLASQYIGNTSDSYSLYLNQGGSNVQKYNNSANGGTISSYAVNDVFGLAVDLATGKFWLSRNGVWQNAGDPISAANPVYTMGTGIWYIGYSAYNLNESGQFNFEAQDLVYLPPDGFYAAGEASLADYAAKSAIAHWPMNETSGTTAYDVASTYHGTYEAGAAINQSGVLFESTTKSVLFDGSDDRITFPSNVFTSARASGSWSIECFVKVVNGGTDTPIWYLGSSLASVNDQISLVSGPTGNQYLKVLFNDSSGNALTSLTAAAATFAGGGCWNQWIYVAVVKSGTNTGTLYINGVQADTQTITNLPATDRPVFKVANNPSANTYTNAYVSNLSYHTVALTAAYITRRFLAGVLIYTHYAKQVAPDGPLAYWKLSESTGLTAYDHMRNLYNGTLYGTFVYAANSGVLAPYDKALQFNGTDSCVEIPSASWNQITGSLTLEAVIKHDGTSASADQGIITKYINDTGQVNQRAYSLVWQSNNKIAFYVSSAGNNATSITTTNALSLNTWYHVMAVYTAGSRLEIFINGVSAGYNTTSIPASLYASTAPVYIGNQYLLRGTTGSNIYRFSGWISDVLIYNKAMVAADALNHYTYMVVDYYGTSQCTLNPNDKSTALTLSNNNFTATNGTATRWDSARATQSRRSGKYYFEAKPLWTADPSAISNAMGITSIATTMTSNIPTGSASNGSGVFMGDTASTTLPTIYTGQYGVGPQRSATTPPGAIYQIAVDFDNDMVWFGLSNSWFASGDPANGLNPLFQGIYGARWLPFISQYGTSGSMTIAMSADLCSYTPPSGFSYWDTTGIASGATNAARVTRSQLQTLTVVPPTDLNKTRVTRSQLQFLTSAPDPKIGTALCSKMLLSVVYGYPMNFQIFNCPINVICRKNTGATVYKLSGYVLLSTNPVARKVRAHKSIDGTVVGTAMSSPTTGYFEITTTYNLECYIIAFDDLNAPDLASIIYDRVFPVLVS